MGQNIVNSNCNIRIARSLVLLFGIVFVFGTVCKILGCEACAGLVFWLAGG